MRKTTPSAPRKVGRRTILRGAAAAGAATLTAPLVHAGSRRSDDIRVVVAGLNGRGGSLVRGFEQLDGVVVVGLCDVDSRVLERRRSAFETEVGRTVEGFVDLRDALRRDDVDVVGLATPNHLHAIQTIWACQAGKDVYVEKPVSHNIWEGGQMVRAARKYDRIVQAGMQSRSSGAIRDAIEWVHAGHIGAVTHGWGTCFKPRQSIGAIAEPTPVPEEVDWTLYMGPRGTQPLMRQRLHYDWHWQWGTGNGDLGNQGVHQLDVLRWAIGANELPRSAASIGGRFGYEDDGETPNTLLTKLEFESAPILFEVRGLPGSKEERGDATEWRRSMDRRLGSAVGAVLHTEGGYVVFPSYSQAVAHDATGAIVEQWKGAEDHFANFIAAVRSRDRNDLNAEIREGHVSAGATHMANTSYRLGAPLVADAIESTVATEPLLSHGFDRLTAHLAANEIDLERSPLRLGATLRLDPETELYEGDVSTRGEYVEGFRIPEDV